LGCLALSLGILGVREFRARTGDFSEWITSDATKLNRRLWFANAWIRMVALLLIGLLFAGFGVWLMLKN
jgi:hypothetical protein